MIDYKEFLSHISRADASSEVSERVVEIADVEHTTETLTTYNLEVANAHTFFIGEDGGLVHNSNLDPWGCPLPSKPPLKRIHSEKGKTQDLVDSLHPDAERPLRVKPDGRIFDGNTRIMELERRGYPVNSLPRAPAD